MADSAKLILEREKQWCKWKENKCYSYEKNPNEKISEKILNFRKRDKKREDKLLSRKIEARGLGPNSQKSG